MKPLDRFVQRLRIGKALPWIPDGARVLDVGCHQGELFERLGERLGSGVGIDPALAEPSELGRVRLLPGHFPEELEEEPPFDVVTLLAVFEHVPDEEKPALAAACREHLEPGGRAILTVPSPRVDGILDVLLAMGLVDGMSLDEHHGFDPRRTPAIFTAQGFELEAARTFQLGLNHLFVFRRPELR
jgi:2-polyprenyl-3-methyl-5-hydroxy-6-metoxy-1,4-benzoquinol methylase